MKLIICITHIQTQRRINTPARDSRLLITRHKEAIEAFCGCFVQGWGIMVDVRDYGPLLRGSTGIRCPKVKSTRALECYCITTM